MHTIAPPDAQRMLLEVAPSFNITRSAQARNAYGTMASELVCATLGLQVVRIHGGYTCCFDAYKEGTYFEIKSVKRRGKVVVYDWRVRKEQEAGVPLNYAIMCHYVKRSNGRHLLEEMVASRLELLVAPAALMHEVAAGCELKTIKAAVDPACGYSRRGYREGYRNVPVEVIKARLTPWCRLPVRYAGVTFDVNVWTLTGIGVTA